MPTPPPPPPLIPSEDIVVPPQPQLVPFESRLDDDDGDENWEDSACSQVLNLAEEVWTSGGEVVDLEDLYEMNWYGEVARSASQTKSWLCNSGR